MLCCMAGAPLHTGPVLLAIAEALHAFLYHTLAHVPLTLPSESFPLTPKKAKICLPQARGMPDGTAEVHPSIVAATAPGTT